MGYQLYIFVSTTKHLCVRSKIFEIVLEKFSIVLVLFWYEYFFVYSTKLLSARSASGFLDNKITAAVALALHQRKEAMLLKTIRLTKLITSFLSYL